MFVTRPEIIPEGSRFKLTIVTDPAVTATVGDVFGRCPVGNKAETL